jgi:hypothetical protein
MRVDSRASEVAPEFLETCRADLLTIRNAMVTADYASVADLGHRLHGTGFSLGFDFVTEIGGEIAEAAEHRDRSVMNELIKTFEHFLNHVEVVADEPALPPKHRRKIGLAARWMPITWS